MDAAHEPNRLRTPRPAGPVQCEAPAGRTVSRDRSGLSGGGRRTRSGPAEGMGTRGDDLHARRWRITNNRSEGDAGELERFVLVRRSSSWYLLGREVPWPRTQWTFG